MVAQLNRGDLHAGFFTSHAPSEPLKTVLNSSEIRLLSLDARALNGLVGPAFVTATIEQGTYACQLEGEPAIQTIATRAVLVCTDDLDDVYHITRAIFDGAAYLEVAVTAGMVVTQVVWSLDSRPVDSSAVLTESPLDLSVPMYDAGDVEA